MRGHLLVAVAVVLAVLFVRWQLGWRQHEIWIAVGILGSWLIGSWLWGRFVSQPGLLKALSIFDEKGGWKDRYSSALFFLTETAARQTESQARQLHLTQCERSLPDALSSVNKILPLPDLRWVWVAPVIALVFALSSFLRPAIDAGDVLLTKEMQEAAAEQAQQLQGEGDRIKNLSNLSKEEKEELEELRSQVDDVASELASAEGQTAMEVLEALEARARAAERLADKLGLSSDAWASDQMLAEMSQHPDMADLALALKDKEAELAASESDMIAALLNEDGLSQSIQERVTTALERTTEAATEDDNKKPVGERVGNASRKMLDRSPKTAAREFEELADHFRVVKDREEARKRLEELANKMRDAGSEISGSKLQKMQKLAQDQRKESPTPKGLQKLDANPLANQTRNQQTPQLPQPGPQGGPQMGKNGMQQQPAPVPGSSPKGGQNPKSGGLKAPIPGQGPNKSGDGKGFAMGGKGKDGKDGKGGGGSLSAPIPGMSPGAMTPGQGLGGGQGDNPSNGGQGGNEAGSGTAEMVDSPSEITKASKDAKVVAQSSKTGDSTTRAIEGQARTEQAERSRQELLSEFMSAEEQALDSQTLPMSRRNHVLRYFSEIRKQFETEKSPAKSP